MLPQWKMSVASLVQRYNGTSWPRDKLGSCLHLECEYLRHNPQFETSYSNCSFSPGQYTVFLACSLHLFKPKCPSWINFNMASHFLFGITILVPFMIKPSSTVSSSLNVQYGCRTGGTCLDELGHPCITVCFNKASSSSASVDTLSLFKLSFLQIIAVWFGTHEVWVV